jgi:ketosteroid isomerase-like protein
MTSAEQSKKVVQDFYAAAGGGDPRALAPYVHEDFEIEEPALMPYGGVYRGLEGLQSVLGEVAGVLDFSRLQVESMIAEDEHVVVTLQVGVHGSDALVRNAEHWTVRDGKVWRGRVFTFDPTPVLDLAGAADGSPNA